MYDLIWRIIGLVLLITSIILIWKQGKLLIADRKLQAIDFEQKFTNYIQRNRTDIQNWTNSNKKTTDELDERLKKIEQIVLPPKRKP